MKKFLYFCLLLTMVLTLLLCSCAKRQKDVLEISKSEADYTTDQLISEADLIVKGRISSVNEGVMTNPNNDKTLKDDQGRGYANEQIHTYIFEIDTVYKGDCTSETIEIKTSNGYGLSPDLIIYGEDETTILSDTLDRFDLKVDSECILTLRFVNRNLQVCNGYYVHGEEQGVFSIEQEELFTK